MKRFFQRNIGGCGRLARAITAVVLVLSGVLVFRRAEWAGVLLIGIGAFVAFEAVRGWCFLRACGIKTKW
jgi:hypothetical protein